MRTIISLSSVFVLTLVLACSSGGGGGSSPDAAPVQPDAAPVQPDAAVPSGPADGQACSATQDNPSGGCPAGFACLTSGCAQLCELGTNGQPTAAICPGYTGPGVSSCQISLQDQAGMTVAAACVIFCADSTGMVPGCTAGQCDGSCPNALECKQHPNPNAPVGVKICQ